MTASEQVISQLKGSLKENLPLTYNTDEMRALLKTFETEKKPPSLKITPRFKKIEDPDKGDTPIFRGLGANGNFVQKAELGFWAGIWSKIKRLWSR